MANRSIQAKVVKLKRAFRAAPKRYNADVTHVGQTPLRDFITEGSKRATSGISTTIRRRTTSAAEAEEQSRLLILESMFPSMFGHRNNVPRAEVFRKIAEGIGDIPIQQHIVLTRTEWVKIMLFFDASKSKYQFVHIDLMSETVKLSVNYGSRERAFSVFKQRTVMYKKPMRFGDPEANRYVPKNPSGSA